MSRNNFYSVFFTLFFILFFTFSGRAQVLDSLPFEVPFDTIAFDPKDAILDFPWKPVFEMRVSVGSKKEENISDAPNTITAYSPLDVNTLGYYTLADLASITSGYSVNYEYGEAGFETRGQTAGGFNNNKHLLLIDGIPVNFARSYKAQIQEELPIFFAERIEFLKGPASALYGASAFYGVVSVISKDPISNGTIAESKLSAGTYDRNKRFMGNVYHRSNSGLSSLNVGYYSKYPSRDFIGSIDDPDYRYYDRNNSLFIKASHNINSGHLKGLVLGVIYMQRQGGLGETWNNVNFSSEVNNIVWKTFIPYLKYQKQISKKLIFNSYLKGNNSIEEAEYQQTDLPDSLKKKNIFSVLSIYRSDVRNIETLGELRYELNTRNSLIIGLNYDRRVEEGNPHSYAYKVGYPDTSGPAPFPLDRDFSQRSFFFNTISGYGQYQKTIDFLSGLTITGGLRYDLGIIDIFTYDQLSPRIAIVQKITPTLNFKMMSGRALRTPGIKELGLTAQYLDELRQKNATIPTLTPVKAEVINTAEASLSYNNKFLRLSASVFYNETDDEIAATRLEVIVNQNDTLRGNYINNREGITTSKGFEIDLVAVVREQLKIFSNYTYAVAKDSNEYYFQGIPMKRLNTGMMYVNSGKFKFSGSLIAKYVDGFLTSESSTHANNGYLFIDANFIVPIAENFSVEIQGRNLLNQKVKIPPRFIPLPGRTFMFSVNLKL